MEEFAGEILDSLSMGWEQTTQGLRRVRLVRRDSVSRVRRVLLSRLAEDARVRSCVRNPVSAQVKGVRKDVLFVQVLG